MYVNPGVKLAPKGELCTLGVKPFPRVEDPPFDPPCRECRPWGRG
jgi:hypothetical protein